MTEQKTRISDEETKKLQAYILDIMVNIDRVCREHHLRYYLLAGTMLGAVRHCHERIITFSLHMPMNGFPSI